LPDLAIIQNWRGHRSKILGGFLAVVILTAMVVYGISVYVEHHLIALSHTTRNLEEDNQDLQLTLDRLRSYEKVGDDSTKVQGLQAASEVVDVAAGPPTDGAQPLNPHSENNLPPPIYGY
jgi:hypothetical protein